MTYADFDTSIDDGSPFYLFSFTQGSDSYYYTSVEDQVVFDGNTYLPTPIRSDRVTQSNNIERSVLKLEVPRGHALAEVIRAAASELAPLNVTILRAHDISSPVTTVVFKGRLTSSNTKGQILEAGFEALNSTMRRNGLRARYQKPCRHVLYSSSCGVNINDHKTTVTVTQISGRDVTVGSIPGEEGAYIGGVFDYLNNLYTIMGQSGLRLTLKRVPSGLSLGDSVVISPGCPLNIETCNSRFNNADNFGGWPYTPNENPLNGFGGSIP